MRESFKQEIVRIRNEGKDLFYNGTGLTEAYKLNVKHISAAPAFGYGLIMARMHFKAFESIILVDFENEKISNAKLVEIIDLEK